MQQGSGNFHAPAVTAVELADGIVGPVQQVEAFQFPVAAGAGDRSELPASPEHAPLPQGTGGEANDALPRPSIAWRLHRGGRG